MSQTPAYAGNAAVAENPGKTLGIVANNQSKRAGFKNGPAKAAIILSIIFMVLQIIAIILFVTLGAGLIGNAAAVCAENGPGEWVVGGVTYTCS